MLPVSYDTSMLLSFILPMLCQLPLARMSGVCLVAQAVRASRMAAVRAVFFMGFPCVAAGHYREWAT